ncbi:MAG: glycosyltransferase family 4 protein [Hyphomicrobium sp.]|jgi:glycosyltransferase involved in cell wall biosynthesis
MQSVLILAQLPPPVHGVTVMTKSIHDYLSDASDISIAQQWAGGAEDLGDIGARRIRKVAEFAWFAASLLARPVHTRQRADVAYVTMAPWAAAAIRDAALATLAQRLACRTLLHVHGEGLDEIVSGKTRRSRLMRRLLRGSEVIAITSKCAEVAKASGLFTRVWLLPNFAPDPGSPARQAGPTLVAGYFANLDPRKGLLRFVSAIAAARSANLPVRAVIAGAETRQMTYAALEALVAREGVQDVVEIKKPPLDKDGFFRQLDCFVYPTEHDHAPLVLLEAMSHGVAPITCDTGGIAEIMGPGLAENVVPARLSDNERNALIVARIATYANDPSALSAARDAARRRFLGNYTEARFRRVLDEIIRG